MLSALTTHDGIAHILIYSDAQAPSHPLFSASSEGQSWRVQGTNQSPDDWSEVSGAALLLDANQGLSAQAIAFWQAASDESVARHVLITNSVGGRADFDEMVAIVRRVLEEDAQVRYFPLADDDESHAVGLLDIVNQEVISFTAHREIHSPADLEHMELTADNREELFDVCAHASFNDENLQNFNAGLPLDLRAMRAATLSSDVVLISPCEHEVGLTQFFEWCSARVN